MILGLNINLTLVICIHTNYIQILSIYSKQPGLLKCDLHFRNLKYTVKGSIYL